MLVFLYVNNIEIEYTQQELEDMIIAVADNRMNTLDLKEWLIYRTKDEKYKDWFSSPQLLLVNSVLVLSTSIFAERKHPTFRSSPFCWPWIWHHPYCCQLKSEKKTHSCHVTRTHALILTNMGAFSLRTKAATIGWWHLNGQGNGLRLPLQPLSGRNKDDVHLSPRRTTKRLPVIGFYTNNGQPFFCQSVLIFLQYHSSDAVSLLYRCVSLMFIDIDTAVRCPSLIGIVAFYRFGFPQIGFLHLCCRDAAFFSFGFDVFRTPLR